MRHRTTLLFLLMLLAAPSLHAQAEAQGYTMGTVATDTPAAMVRRMEPLTRYLSLQTGIPITLRPAPQISLAIEDFGKGVTQIAYLSPVAYLEARDRFGANAVAIPLSEGKPFFRLAIVVRKGSSLKKPSDLIGRSFAFGDEKSLLQRASLEAAGLKIEQFSHYAYLKHHDNVAKAVLNKDFDAGIMKESFVAHYAHQGLHILHLSPPAPTFVIAVSSSFPSKHIPALRDALVHLDAGVKVQRDILTTLDPAYTGFVPAIPRHFEQIVKLIAPYKKWPPAPK